MANASTCSKELNDQEGEDPTLQDIHKLLLSIQETVNKHSIENERMSKDISELKASLELSDQELNKVKKVVEADKKIMRHLIIN